MRDWQQLQRMKATLHTTSLEVRKEITSLRIDRHQNLLVDQGSKRKLCDQDTLEGSDEASGHTRYRHPDALIIASEPEHTTQTYITRRNKGTPCDTRGSSSAKKCTPRSVSTPTRQLSSGQQRDRGSAWAACPRESGMPSASASRRARQPKPALSRTHPESGPWRDSREATEHVNSRGLEGTERQRRRT